MQSNERRDIPRILFALWDEVFSDHMLIVAAGLTFYAVFGLLPALAAAAALWARVGDFASLQQSVASGGGLLPKGSVQLLQQFVTSVPQGFGGGLGLVLNLGLAMLSSYRAASGLLTALNIVYDVEETRGRLRRAVVALAIGVGGTALLFTALALLALPPLLAERQAWSEGKIVLWLRWPGLAVVFTLGLGLLFRYGVSRAPGQRWPVASGAIAATLLWIAASFGVTEYADHAGSFGRLYGSLGTVAVVLLWFYASAIAVLAGAEIDATLAERLADAPRDRRLRADLRRRERADPRPSNS